MNGGGSLALELGLERPVLHRDERLDLPLALDHQPHRDRLHPAGGEAAAHLLPEQRADLVADQPVEDPARLLRVVLGLVERARVGDGLLDRLLGDLVEEHPHRVGVTELLAEVPGDRLALAVGVGGEEDLVGAQRGLLELARATFSLLGMTSYSGGSRARRRCPSCSWADPSRGRPRPSPSSRAEVLLDRLGLGRGLHHHQVARAATRGGLRVGASPPPACGAWPAGRCLGRWRSPSWPSPRAPLLRAGGLARSSSVALRPVLRRGGLSAGAPVDLLGFRRRRHRLPHTRW